MGSGNRHGKTVGQEGGEGKQDDRREPGQKLVRTPKIIEWGVEPADEGRMIEIAERQMDGVQNIMSFIHPQAKGWGYKKPDEGKKSN